MEVYKSSHTAEELEIALQSVFSDGSYGEGYVDGEQSAYDTFWDTYQQNGNRTHYGNAFAGWGWYDSNFKPKYYLDDSKEIDAYMMFRNSQITDARPIGYIKAYSCGYMCSNSALQHLGCIYVTDTIMQELFSYSYNLHTIDLLHFQNVNMILTPFVNCISLQNITFGGEIRQSLNMQWSPLSVDSMKSAIMHLKDYSDDAENALINTLTFSESCWASLEASGLSPNGGTWKEYVLDLGWNTN